MPRWEDVQDDLKPNLRRLLIQKKKRKEAPTLESDDTPQCVKIWTPDDKIVYKLIKLYNVFKKNVFAEYNYKIYNKKLLTIINSLEY